MTIAELFSPEPAENLLAALCLSPARVIYLGFRSGLRRHPGHPGKVSGLPV